MKKIISMLIATIIFFTPLSGMAMNIPGYEGGIKNETTYKEVVFKEIKNASIEMIKLIIDKVLGSLLYL